MELYVKFNQPFSFETQFSRNELLKDYTDGYTKLEFNRELEGARWTEISHLSDHFLIQHFEMTNEAALNCRIRKKSAMFIMLFSLSATFMYNFESLSKTLVVQPNQHNIIHSRDFNAACQWAAGNRQQYVMIYLDIEFIKHFIPNNPIFQNYLHQLDQESLGFLSPHNLPITSEMLLLLNDIMNIKRSGAFAKLYLQAKLLELLLLQFEQYESVADNPLFSKLRKMDVDRMVAAKDIINSNLENPCSLIDLAHQVGTNEYNLKKSFKEVFGTTVFGYLTQVRMQKAKEMLLNGVDSINTVAYAVGYSDPTNFTVAFKRVYGMTPSHLIKQNKLSQK